MGTVYFRSLRPGTAAPIFLFHRKQIIIVMTPWNQVFHEFITSSPDELFLRPRSFLMANDKVIAMSFTDAYPHYVAKKVQNKT
jgi:hypothetical protein